MSTMAPEFFEIFSEEAREHFDIITNCLMAIEKTQQDEERSSITQQILRALHSMKGSAYSIGLLGIAELAAEAEELFAQQLAAERDTKEIPWDALYYICDQAITIINGVVEQGVENDQQVRELHSFISTSAGLTPASEVETELPEWAEPTDLQATCPQPETPRRTETHPTPPSSSVPMAEAEPSVAAQRHAPSALDDKGMVRIATRKINSLSNKIDELQEIKFKFQGLVDQIAALTPDVSEEQHLSQSMQSTLQKEILNLVRVSEMNIHSLNRIVGEIRDEVRSIRMVPFATVVDAHRRTVRELARTHKKRVQLEVKGEDTEIDRLVLERLKEPITHLLRNSIAHGIEPAEDRARMFKPEVGTITLTTVVSGNQVGITISDDGCGIALDAVRERAVDLGYILPEEAARMESDEMIQLIFNHGLSTKKDVDLLAGRGVGMDVVRRAVASLSGNIEVSTIAGEQTAFTLHLPLTLSTSFGVLVRCISHVCVIPSHSVAGVKRFSSGDVEHTAEQNLIMVDDEAVSLYSLPQILGLSTDDKLFSPRSRPAVLLRVMDTRIAVEVDEVIAEQEIVVKGMGPYLSDSFLVDGFALTNTGEVIPVLNPYDVYQQAMFLGGQSYLGSMPSARSTVRQEPRRILIADDSITTRTMEKNVLELAGFQVTTAANGAEALDLFRRHSYDLLISDVQMPHMDGLELTSTIKADPQLNHIPIILVTALSSAADRQRGLHAGASAYLVKSDFNKQELFDLITDLIEAR